jgi:GTP-binding protein
VGKSTLFNYLVGQRMAIVEDMPGVTRDRLYGEVNWLNHHFSIVDTGGLDPLSTEPLIQSVARQAQIAMEEADLILFLVDGREGVAPLDQEAAQQLRRTRKPVLLVVNKIDAPKFEHNIHEFYELGFGDPFSVSAANALGLGDLLDEIVKNLPSDDSGEEDEELIRVALVGRPNVGKSSLVNAFVGEERVIVSNIPGTTRDATDTPFEQDGQRFMLIDTAGLRRQAKVEEGIEWYSSLRSYRAVERADVAVVVLDATRPLAEQDKHIAGYAHEKGKAIVVAVNKWDAVEKDTHTVKQYTDILRAEFAFMAYAPVVFVSAKTGKRLPQLLETVVKAAEANRTRIATSALNQLIREATATTPPPTDKGKQLKINYMTQAGVKPPHFVIFVNDPDLMHFSYQRFIENRLRDVFGFEGTPLQFTVRQRHGEEEGDR